MVGFFIELCHSNHRSCAGDKHRSVEGARSHLSPLIAMPNPFIKIEDVSLEFCMYGNSAGSLKEWLLNKIVGGGKRHSDLRFHALKNFNLEVRSGARVGIVGLNGAGKSTLLKVINGIYLPQTGRLEVQGEIIPLIELGTGFDIQLTGRENIAFNWVMLGRSLSDLKRLERNIIAFAELEEFIDMPIKYYSSGMTARLAFSIATAVRPDILLIDEIFSTGDERFVEKA